MCDQSNIFIIVTSAFMIKKAKTVKNLLDKKVPTASIVAFALRFLESEK